VVKLLIGCIDPAWGIALGERIAQEMHGACECVVRGIDRLVEGTATLRPDVLLLESRGDDGAGALVTAVVRTNATTRVLLFCEDCSRELVMEALESGASGCLFKSSPGSAFAEAVSTAHRGATWFCREVLLHALGAQPVARAPAPPAEEGKLTRREDEIMILIGAGLSNKEIARRLAISDHTVKTHLHRVYVKLHRSGRYKALLAQPALGADSVAFTHAALPAAHPRND
jgi:DNA-binding NarL/FixJ family response regulator